MANKTQMIVDPATWKPFGSVSIRVPIIVALAAITAAGVTSWFSENGLAYLRHAYLVGCCFVTSLALGALFFVILQHLTRAKWSVVLRRVAEVMAAAICWMPLFFLPIWLLILLGDGALYSWNDEAVRANDALVQGKAAYLNGPFFVLRSVLYFAIWGWMARYFWKNSVAQDQTGDPRLTGRMRRASAVAMIVYALTVCFAGFDWLMSLDPHWFSTIFGVYFFSGAVVAFFAALIVVVRILDHFKLLKTAVTAEHYHDLGKFLLGFVFFWAYIAFSQYLLLWYANIPEETGWYLVRQSNGWQWIAIALVVGHYFLPFCALMPRAAKRKPAVLTFWAAWVLVMHWLDLHWLVMPNHSSQLALGIVDLLMVFGLVSALAAVLLRTARNRSLVPIRDPFLAESLAFENQ